MRKRAYTFLICAGRLNDLRALLHPKETTWNHSGKVWLLDIYDWDVIFVDQHYAVELTFDFKLCFDFFPCSMLIKGRPVGVIQRQGSGYISCLNSDGCETFRLEGIRFTCDSSQYQRSAFKVQASSLTISNSSFSGCSSGEDGGVIQSSDGSTVMISMSSFTDLHSSAFKVQASSLTISNSSFSGCSSGEDGGVIQSSDGSTVMISMSSFTDLHSSGFGGSIAACNSRVHISNSSFSNSTATLGGGVISIWPTGFQSCNGLSQKHDSTLEIKASTFVNCSTKGDGGVLFVSSNDWFDDSTAKIDVSSFIDSRSDGFGGVIASYGGSVRVFNSSFSDNTAILGGGAIWLTAYPSDQKRYEQSQYHDSALEIKASMFSNCTTEGDGGAIFVSSDVAESRSSTESLVVEINSSTFSYCQSSGYGGALQISGYSVIANISLEIHSCSSTYSGGAISASYGVSLALHGSNIYNNFVSSGFGGAISVIYGVSLALDESNIHNNIASGCGGAISANNSEIILMDTNFNQNSALGFGGGAIFLKETSISAFGTSCSGNRAPSGGGGVLLSQGSNPPMSEMIINMCKVNNSAVYGPCVASDCKSLYINYNTSTGLNSSWAGLPFKLAVSKLDAYHQTILSDYSLVQILPSSSHLTALEDLNAKFSFLGSSLSQYVRGYALIEIAIKPNFIEVNATTGVARIQSQPNIFAQSLDSMTSSTIKSGIISIKLDEGGSVCPQGYVLDLDTTNMGVCKLCQTGTYRVSPLTSSQGSCLNCPAGALCPDGSCVFRHSLSSRSCPGGHLIVGDWVMDNSSRQFSLRGCPPGYSVGSQQCDLCPASYYCSGGSVPSRPCPSNKYAPPGANSSVSCAPSVFVSVTVSVPIKRPDFKDDSALQFQKYLANLTKWDPGFVAIKLVQSGDDPETTIVVADIVAPDASVAAALVKSLDSRILAVASGLASYGGYEDRIILISVQVTSCVPGYELSLHSKSCQLCPANYFCVGGNQGKEICPTDLGFSPPGSNTTASCTSAVFVTLVFTIPIFQENITDTLKLKLVAAVSLAAGIASERVTISLGGAARRAEGHESVCKTAKSAAEDAAFAAERAVFAAESAASAATHICQYSASDSFELPYSSGRERANMTAEKARRSGDRLSARITAKLAAEDAASAAAIKGKIDQSNLNKQLLANGLPQSTLISISSPEASAGNSEQMLSTSAVTGISVGVILLAVLSVGGYCLTLRIRSDHEHAECASAIRNSAVGAAASEKHLPLELRRSYSPEIILKNCICCNGCVVQAKQTDSGQSSQTKSTLNSLVAIKIITPLRKTFKERDLYQLRQEGRVLALLAEKRCEYTSRLFLGSGQGVRISTNMCWFVMDLLKGDAMDTIIHPAGTACNYSDIQGQPGQRGNIVAPFECIHVARDILAALKVVHGEGMLHLNIQPSNIFRSNTARLADRENDTREFTYKLIGFDTSDTAGKETVASSAGTLSIGAGMPAYMSPEMFRAPGNATYPADLWALGVAMFELVTGSLPFQAGSNQDWKAAICGNMEGKAPTILDRTYSDRQPQFDHSLALVIAKALEKKTDNRYLSADEMHGAVFGCLVVHDKAAYSAYLSYRAESDWPLAKLLFDELNHSQTPGGHRVTVYLDSCGGHAWGTDWTDDITKGLLHSICYVPILSYGATAPMAQHVDSEKSISQLIAREETLPGLGQLGCAAQDCEDALLQEMLIASLLLKRSSESDFLLSGEKGQLCAVFPVFTGRQQPQGSPEYPSMNNGFDVQVDDGKFLTKPSPINTQAAARILLDRAGLPVDVVDRLDEQSVASVVSGLSSLPGCCLWNHAGDLAEAALTIEQKALVGKGYAGPPALADLDNSLSPGQVTRPSPGPWSMFLNGHL